MGFKPFSFTQMIGASLPDRRDSDYRCESGIADEDVTVTLPGKISPFSLPASRSLKTEGTEFRQSFEKAGPHAIRAHVSVKLQHAGQVCTPAYYNKVHDDLGSHGAKLECPGSLQMNWRIALALIGGALISWSVQLLRPNPNPVPTQRLPRSWRRTQFRPIPSCHRGWVSKARPHLQWISEADGIPAGTRVVKSSGSGRLDDAAASFVKENWRWQAPTRKCKPIASATNVSVAWDLTGRPPGMAFTVITAADSDFPKGAKAEGAHGNTGVVVIIAPDGTVSLQLAGSSGFNDLDGAAFDKVRAMKFSPATSNGKPVSTVLFFRIDWGTPASPPQEAPKAP